MFQGLRFKKNELAVVVSFPKAFGRQK